MALLCLVCGLAKAEEGFSAKGYNLVLSLRSYHTDRAADYNESNWGIGFEKEFNDRWKLIVGVYDNSLDRQSEYVGFAYTPWKFGNVKLGAVGLAVTGYSSKNPDRWLPICCGGVVVYERKTWGLNFPVFPPLDGHGGAVGLQFFKRF